MREAWKRVVLLLLAAGTTACDLPRDPEGTLERVRGGTLRVGVVENPPWVAVRDGRIAGIEPGLLSDLAADLGADIEWVPGAESRLMPALERFQLDVVAGGLVRSDPWRRRVAFTRPYHADSLVLAVPPGENAWLVRLERFLHAQQPRIRALVAEPPRAADPTGRVRAR